jgi:hypothetical protein
MQERMRINGIIFCIACLLSISSSAQNPDPGKQVQNPGHIEQINPDSSQRYPAQKILHSAILPVTLFAYGIVALKSDVLQHWNEELHNEIWTKHPHPQTNADNFIQWSPAVAVFGLNLIGVHGEHNLADRSILFGMALLIQEIIVFPTKRISGEYRPNGQGTESFPSGHTANAFAGAEFFRREFKNLSPWYSVAAFVAAGTTGFLRMYNNKHWFSDVVAGAGAGILSTDLSYLLFPVVKKIFFRHTHRSAMVMPTYSDKIFGVALAKGF